MRPELQTWLEVLNRQQCVLHAALAAARRVRPDVAEDAAQFAFARAIEREDVQCVLFADIAHLRGWTCRTARNYVIGRFRRTRREKSLCDEGIAGREPSMSAEDAALVRECWDALSAEDREHLTWYHLDEVGGYSEMAEVFLPPGDGSDNARLQRIRKMVLAAQARFDALLLAAGVDPAFWRSPEAC